MTDVDDYRQAMVLSGGGAYGAYEVGVMEALFKGKSPATNYTPTDPVVFAGTSVGAFNASVIVSQPDADSSTAVDYLKEVWINVMAENPQRCGNGVYRLRGDPLTFLSPQCLTTHPIEPIVALAADSTFFTQDWLRRGVNFFSSSGDIEQRALDLIDLSTLFSTLPFQQTVRETISMEGIRRSNKALRIAATNWKLGEPIVFRNKDMTDQIGHEAILASAALPGIFPPVEIAGVPFVDGGVSMNTPLLPAIRAGADTIHIVFLDPPLTIIPLDRLQNSIDTFYRTQVIEWAVKATEDMITVKWINRGLVAIERSVEGKILSNLGAINLIRALGPIGERIAEGFPYKKLTIHRYRPRYESGGALGLLDLSLDNINNLITQGFDETVAHNCAANECVLPE